MKRKRSFEKETLDSIVEGFEKKEEEKETVELVKKYEGYLLAKSNIVHMGDEKTGSTPILRTIYMNVEGGDCIQIPYINGNAIRGKLRRLLMLDFFNFLYGSLDELDIKLYHLFFSGGLLETGENIYGMIDLGMRKKIRDYLPPLSLLGGAVGNQILAGKLKVGHAFPVCLEYQKFLPDFLAKDERSSKQVRVFIDEVFQTRRDDLKAGRLEDEQALQMKIDYECFIPGTKFYHWFCLDYADNLESSCFGRMMELFGLSPFLGGKSATGHGEIVFEYFPLFPSSKEYLGFLFKNKNNILSYLDELRKALIIEKKKREKIKEEDRDND